MELLPCVPNKFPAEKAFAQVYPLRLWKQRLAVQSGAHLCLVHALDILKLGL